MQILRHIALALVAMNVVSGAVLYPTSNVRSPLKLSSEAQFWCPIVEASLASAASFEPSMRSFVLDTIARGLKECEPDKVRNTLVESFDATLVMPEHEEEVTNKVREYAQQGNPFGDPEIRAVLANIEIKRQLQTYALEDLLRVDEAKVQMLLPQA